MRKTICLALSLCLCLLAATSASASSLEVAQDDNAAIIIIGDDESSAPEETPQPEEAAQSDETSAEDDGEDSGLSVRWTYPVAMHALQSDFMVLCNADYLLDKDFEPSPLVRVDGVKRATSATLYMQETAAYALVDFFEAAALVTEYTYTTESGNTRTATYDADTGMRLYLKSAYRSYATQTTTYNNYLARNNNVDDGYVAKPGASEHQTGLCADILNDDYANRPRMTQDFKWTAEAQWMLENCAYFGFILRFPEDKEAETGIKFEPWHFRYVGKEAATYIMSRGMSLEEFTNEWQFEVARFVGEGGDIDAQIAYELSRLNAPPESVVLDTVGEDGDAETSLVF